MKFHAKVATGRREGRQKNRKTGWDLPGNGTDLPSPRFKSTPILYQTFSLVVFLVGIVIFRHVERTFSDTI